jgi:hypothetical protein
MRTAVLNVDQVEIFDNLVIEQHNATHPEELSPYGWTDEWVFRVLLTMPPVRASRQEEEALWNFEHRLGR